MTMTFEEYDSILKQFESMSIPVFFPTLAQIDLFDKEPNKWLFFCCYLYEKSQPTQTAAERYSKQNMMFFINKHLKLV